MLYWRMLSQKRTDCNHFMHGIYINCVMVVMAINVTDSGHYECVVGVAVVLLWHCSISAGLAASQQKFA